MARFATELPEEIIRELTDVENSEMFSEMVDAGGDVVLNNVRQNMKRAFKDTTRLEPHLKKTKVYRTYTDDAINCKVAFYGYMEGTEGKITKFTRKTKYKVRYTKGKSKGKLVKQNIGRAGTVGAKTYSHDYGTPAPLVAIAREYGTSKGEKKKPFVRPAFKKGQITDAMLKVQGKYIKDE